MVDTIQHNYWRYMEPGAFDPKYWGEPSKDDMAMYKDRIRDAYLLIDKWIGKMTQRAGKDTLILVISDHGGMAADKPTKTIDLEKLVKAAGLPVEVKNSYTRNGLMDTVISTKLDEGALIGLIAGIKNGAGNAVFTLGGRRAYGDYVLSQSTDVFENDEKIRAGAGEYTVDSLLIEGNVSNSGLHDYNDAVFVAYGGNVRKGLENNGISVYDIAPTVLFYAGLGVASDMKGSVVSGIFEPAYLAAHKIRSIKSYENGKPNNRPAVETPEDKKTLKELKSLGYIQ